MFLALSRNLKAGEYPRKTGSAGKLIAGILGVVPVNEIAAQASP
jgi:hypothetical protein